MISWCQTQVDQLSPNLSCALITGTGFQGWPQQSQQSIQPLGAIILLTSFLQMDAGCDLAELGGAVQVGDLQPTSGPGVREREGLEVLVRHRGPRRGGHSLWIPEWTGCVQETPAHQGLVPR